jgi:hypothetical protein
LQYHTRRPYKKVRAVCLELCSQVIVIAMIDQSKDT